MSVEAQGWLLRKDSPLEKFAEMCKAEEKVKLVHDLQDCRSLLSISVCMLDDTESLSGQSSDN